MEDRLLCCYPGGFRGAAELLLPRHILDCCSADYASLWTFFKSIHSCSNTAMRFFVIGNLIGRLKQRFIFVLLGRRNGLNHYSFQGTHCCHEFFVLFYIFEGNFRVISSWLIGGGGWVGLFTISWSGKGQGYWRRTRIHIFLFWCRHIFGMTGVPYICNGASLQVWQGTVVGGLLAWCPWGWHQLEVTPMGIRRPR